MKTLRTTMRVERTALTEVRIEPDDKRRCKSNIVLGAVTYRCVRGGRHRVHDGAHDANRSHTDGYLVRW